MATDALTYVAQRVATQTRESKLLELYLILVEGIEVFFPFILLYYLLIYSDLKKKMFNLRIDFNFLYTFYCIPIPYFYLTIFCVLIN